MVIRQYLKNELYNTCFAQLELELEKGEEIQFPCLVRGSELHCSCGTDKRKLNLPTCHGVYGNLQDVRIIHNNNWQQEIRDLLEVA